MAVALTVAWSAAGSACGDDAGMAGGADGGSDAGASRAAEPDIPWLAAGAPPVQLPHAVCPAGWREAHPIAEEPGVTTCDPWPASGRAACTAVDEAHFVGEPGCARVGPPCPAGDWAEDLPTDRPVRYVKAGAPAGGDGTQARPFARIGDATTGAAAGTVVALAKGRYDSAVSLGSGVTLWGACVSETVLTSSVVSFTAGVVTSRGPGAGVRNVRFDAPARSAIYLDGAAAVLDVEAVVVEGAPHTAVHVLHGASLTARSLVVRGTRVVSGQAFGLAAQDATAEVTHAVLSADEVPVYVDGATGRARLVDTALVESASVVPMLARASVLPGATLEMERFSVDTGPDIQAIAAQDAHLVLTDGVVRGSVLGVTVIGTGASTLRAERLWLDGGRLGLQVLGGTGDVQDCVATSARSGAAELRGHGITCFGAGSTFVARRIAVSRAAGTAVVAGMGCEATFEDVLIHAPPHPAPTLSEGIMVFQDASAAIDRVIVRGADKGLVAWGTRVRVTDLLVADSARGECTAVGFFAAEGGDLAVARALVDRAATGGGFARTSTLRVTDLVIRDGQGCGEGIHGEGLLALEDAMIDASRIRIERSRYFGAGSSARSTLVLTDATIIDARPQLCAGSTCAATGGGVGVLSIAASNARLSRVRISGAALCGLLVSDSSGLDVASSDVSGAAIGACVQRAGYDVARLENDVAYHDNGVNLQATELPLPMPADLALTPP